MESDFDFLRDKRNEKMRYWQLRYLSCPYSETRHFYIHINQIQAYYIYDVENLLISALFPKILADYNSMSKMAKVSRQLTGICSRSVAYEILHTLDSSFPLLEFVTLAFKITISWTTTQLSIFFYLYNHTALRIDTLSSYYS